jgi:hypothetical protein
MREANAIPLVWGTTTPHPSLILTPSDGVRIAAWLSATSSADETPVHPDAWPIGQRLQSEKRHASREALSLLPLGPPHASQSQDKNSPRRSEVGS